MKCDHVVLFIMLYKLALTFATVSDIYKCDHSNERERDNMG